MGSRRQMAEVSSTPRRESRRGTRTPALRVLSHARRLRPGRYSLEGRMPIPTKPVQDPLSSFTPRVREWFARAFASPTPAQAQAWPAIAAGEHVLLSAPTGSGKTLAPFLWALDRLSSDPATPTGDAG